MEVIMCEPTYFDVVTVGQNPFMRRKGGIDKKKAKIQWDNLVHTIRGLGYTVKVIRPNPAFPDQVFTQDQAIVEGGRMLLANFSVEGRRGEEKEFAKIVRAGTQWTCPVPFECELLLSYTSSTKAWMGYGIRSHMEAIPCVRKIFPKVTPLRLIDPRFYHIDLVLCILPKDVAIVYFPAFDMASQELIRKTTTDRYELSEDEALQFMANAVSLGDAVVANSFSRPLAAWLRLRSLRPITCPVTEFHESGGSVHCLVNKIRK